MASPGPAPDGISVFDRALHARRRARAAAGFAAHDFLVRRAAAEIAERLADTNRSFPLALDIGCHRGALAETNMSPGKIGTLIQSDLSPAMVARAGGLRVAADEEALPFGNESFDLISSTLSLHWVNDVPGALVQIRRALKPDGLFVGALFGGATLTELRQSFAQAEVECDGGLSPRVSPFADVRELGHLLQRAGFALPVTDTDTVTVRYETPLHLLAELRGMGETNALIERRRTPLRRATLARTFDIYRERFALADGRVPATFEIIHLSGWAPHESQQKPLRPGSAKARLADALETEERSAGEKTPRS